MVQILCWDRETFGWSVDAVHLGEYLSVSKIATHWLFTELQRFPVTPCLTNVVSVCPSSQLIYSVPRALCHVHIVDECISRA